MTISVKKAKDQLIASVEAMEADLAQYGMTHDDWLKMMEERNAELRRQRLEKRKQWYKDDIKRED